MSGSDFRGPDLRRVVITGMGIVSSIGDSIKEVTESLKTGASGISFIQEYADKGFKSQVAGKPRSGFLHCAINLYTGQLSFRAWDPQNLRAVIIHHNNLEIFPRERLCVQAGQTVSQLIRAIMRGNDDRDFHGAPQGRGYSFFARRSMMDAPRCTS